MVYYIVMHKKSYASGFLYHISSQQILLQQDTIVNSLWSLFGNSVYASQETKEEFHKILNKKLTINISPESIFPVYDYINVEKNAHHFIFYAEVEDIQENILAQDETIVAWFNFKQLKKIPLADQTKQDIIVAQRVILAAGRIKEMATLVI